MSNLPEYKILVIEDNDINQMVIRAMLEKLGQKVSISADGAIAVEFLKSNVVDLILTDLQMPIMNGFEATAAIRNDLKLETPIYAISAEADRETIDQCMNSGMNGYILKPYKFEDLEKIIRSLSTKS